MAETEFTGYSLSEFTSRECDDEGGEEAAVSVADFMEARSAGDHLPLTLVNSLGQRQCLLNSLQPPIKPTCTAFVSDGKNGMNQLPTATKKMLCNDLCCILEGIHKDYKMRIGGSHFKTVMVEQELRSMQLMKSKADKSPDDLQLQQEVQRKKVPKSSSGVIHV